MDRIPIEVALCIVCGAPLIYLVLAFAGYRKHTKDKSWP